MVFNGDGTGVGIFKNGVVKFTWKLNEIGKFGVTYTEGTADDENCVYLHFSSNKP